MGSLPLLVVLEEGKSRRRIRLPSWLGGGSFGGSPAALIEFRRWVVRLGDPLLGTLILLIRRRRSCSCIVGRTGSLVHR